MSWIVGALDEDFTNWTTSGAALRLHAYDLAERARARLSRTRGRRRTLPGSQLELLLTGSISSLPLHKTLVLLDHVQGELQNPMCTPYERLALAKALVSSIGNLHFGPEVGVTQPKTDADVVYHWVSAIDRIADDLDVLRHFDRPACTVLAGDARMAGETIQPGSISAVITSPPYPNEKDYTRATRLESVILGFVDSREALRELKQGLMRSNTRNIYKGDSDDTWVADHSTIQELARSLDEKRTELNRTSGFERLYATVTRQYFGGMARHLESLKKCLRPGAKLAYVVGDQASFFQVLIRTGALLEEIAEGLGYKVIRRDLFRLRHASATGAKLREEVVVLEWPGSKT